MVNLGEEFPNFKADTTVGEIQFHEWLGSSWGILFSHPADFTPVCTTELAQVLKLLPEFQKRNIKPIALSCDTVESHNAWSKDIKSYAKYSEDSFPYPIISDPKRELACQLKMLDPDEIGFDGIPLTARAVFIIDSNKKMRLSLLYPATVGRNFNEILRAIDALQLSDKHKIATPVDWMPGNSVMIQPNVPKEEAEKLFPDFKTVVLPSEKKYMRLTQL